MTFESKHYVTPPQLTSIPETELAKYITGKKACPPELVPLMVRHAAVALDRKSVGVFACERMLSSPTPRET